MASNHEGLGDESHTQHHRNEATASIGDVLWPAVQVGGLSGVSGLIAGGFLGVARSSPPTLFALAVGIQWLTLGATYTGSRELLIHSWSKDQLPARERVLPSALAGAASGAAGGLLRGRGNVLPGAFVFAIFGAAGQVIYNRAGAQMRHVPDTLHEDKSTWMESKWSPVKVLSDTEYEAMLREKLLKVDAEIALVDESLQSLRRKEQQSVSRSIIK